MGALFNCKERTKTTMIQGDSSYVLAITSCSRQIAHKGFFSCQQGKDKLHSFNSDSTEQQVVHARAHV